MKKNIQILKLTIELVPESSFYDNVRKIVSAKQWEIFRKESIQKYDNKCAICEATGRLNCHEIWDYDDTNNIQQLKGFTALCTNCHNIKHIGFAQMQADEGRFDFNMLIEHFCKINNCTKKTYQEHRKEAFSEWHKRSEHDWKIDFGDYSEIIQSNLKKKNKFLGMENYFFVFLTVHCDIKKSACDKQDYNRT